MHSRTLSEANRIKIRAKMPHRQKSFARFLELIALQYSGEKCRGAKMRFHALFEVNRLIRAKNAGAPKFLRARVEANCPERGKHRGAQKILSRAFWS